MTAKLNLRSRGKPSATLTVCARYLSADCAPLNPVFLSWVTLLDKDRLVYLTLDEIGTCCCTWRKVTSVEQFRQDTSDKPHFESSPCLNGRGMGQTQTKCKLVQKRNKK